MDDAIKRLNYFDHQFLQARDFNDEQEYHLQMRRTHNRTLHQWGIADGLAVTPDFESGERRVTVSPGVAIDTNGREMILEESRTINLKMMPGYPDPEVYITIQYDEKQTDTSSEGAEGPTRWTENPKTDALPARPQNEDQQIILAKVILQGEGAPNINLADCRQAGVKGGDLRARSLTLSKRTEPNGNGEPRLIPSGENDIELEGGLKITNGLKITGGKLTVEEDACFFKKASVGTDKIDDEATLNVNGIIKADKIIVREEEGFCYSNWFYVESLMKIDDINNPLGKNIGGFQMFFSPDDTGDNQYMVGIMNPAQSTNGYSLIITETNFKILTGSPRVCIYIDENGKKQEDGEGWYRFVAWRLSGLKLDLPKKPGQKYKIIE
jgi:hypothetical protein